LLELNDIVTHGEGMATSLSDINLSILPGEILGIAGVSGNGQRELGDVVLGLQKVADGTMYISGNDATHWSPSRIRESGVAFIPENPLNMAVVPYLTVQENMALGNPRAYERRGGLTMDWPSVRRDMADSFEKLRVEVLGMDTPVRTLSGGNLQRLVLARELARNPKLIIALYPTRGLDVMSAISARRLLINARDAGRGVLLISEDLGELLTLSDRLIVMYQGRILGEFRPNEVSMKEIGFLMTGSEKGLDKLD
jgi:simple sugar transport system ATP-binding protein